MIKRKLAAIAVLGALVLSILGFSGAFGGATSASHIVPADPPVLPIGPG